MSWGSTAEGAADMAKKLNELFSTDREPIQQKARRWKSSALLVHGVLQRHPLLSIRRIAERAGISVPTATAAVATLEQLGVVLETTGKKRNRLYGYRRYLETLGEGTEPL